MAIVCQEGYEPEPTGWEFGPHPIAVELMSNHIVYSETHPPWVGILLKSYQGFEKH